jgi:hypothetical protein
MTVIRDSGYPRVPSGNVAVDFVYGNIPSQTNDDRSGSSISYNATGGGTGSLSSEGLTAVVTAASATGGVVTYTSNNEFNPGMVVSITGLSTTAFNLTNVVIGTASATQFTVTNAATGTAVTGATAKAVVAETIVPGVGADYGWGTTTDFTSNVLTETQPTVTVGQAGAYVVPNDNTVNILNGWDSFPQNVPNGGFNAGKTLYATITGASGDGTTVTYTGANAFTAGQTVTITGLYNYVLAGSTQPVPTQYYAPTLTTASAYNLSAVTIATASATGFTVTNSTVDSTAATLTNVNGSVRGTATVTIAASASTATVPTVTGLSPIEADRVLGIAKFNLGSVTYTSAGATAANNETVYSQSLTGTQTLGATVNVVVYQFATNETESASETQAQEFTPLI